MNEMRELINLEKAPVLAGRVKLLQFKIGRLNRTKQSVNAELSF